MSMHVFLKTLIVSDTVFQETQPTAYAEYEQIYRPVWRTLTAYHTPAALRPPSVWTYLYCHVSGYAVRTPMCDSGLKVFHIVSSHYVWLINMSL